MSTPEEKLEAFKRLRSISAVARELGVGRSTVQEGLAKLGWNAAKRAEYLGASHEDPAIAEGMDAIGTEMEPTLMWVKTRNDDGTSHSVLLKPRREPEDVAEKIKAALANLPPVEPVYLPNYSNNDLLTIIPLSDVHIGQLSWGKETGADYDTKIAATRVREWVGRVVESAPACGTAIVLSNGDLFHTDDQTNQTPAHRHQLDTDSRFFRTIDIGIAAMAYAVDYALRRNEHVIVRILPGNHDPHSHLYVLFALEQRYMNEPRVTVQKVPGEFFVHQFGLCLFAAHHGHRGKPQDIVLMLADDHPEMWGSSRHRFLFTGHKHHLQAGDIGGVQWIQLRPQTERDAYAKGGAWLSRAQLLGITYHRELGEVQRVSVGARSIVGTGG